MNLFLRLYPTPQWLLLSLLLSLVAIRLPAESTTAPNQSSQFRFPQPISFRLDTAETPSKSAASRDSWIKAWPESGTTNFVEFGSRLVLQLLNPTELPGLLANSGLELSRVVRSDLFILQAPNAWLALSQAERLSRWPQVVACYPVFRRKIQVNGLYAPRSNDPFFGPYFQTGLGQIIDALWPLENKNIEGTQLGVDLNVLAAWPYAQGQGVTVAVGDTGLDLGHAELTNRVAGAPHYNFFRHNTNALPAGGAQNDSAKDFWSHGTAVAGLIAAEGNNGRGMVGVAPQAHLAGWVLFSTNLTLISDEALMDMYQYAPYEVSIQNHSWGSGSGNLALAGPSLLEQAGISNAVALGRHGLGTVMIRAGGNDRFYLANTDDDGYSNDPQVITTGAVTKNGRAAFYSNGGASLLVSAPGGGGDTNQGLFTLDLAGNNRGVNSGIIYPGDLGDYRWGVQGFIGTSAAAPLISGIAALVLSANPGLGYRDVQQILLLASRQWDQGDPDLAPNGAGLVVSHNTGFGVPDAGQAVSLARHWTNRPGLVLISATDDRAEAIPDGGLGVEVTGNNIPPNLQFIPAYPGIGPHADNPTGNLLMVDIGLGTNVPALNLTNQAALIRRGINFFDDKIRNAARAGAGFAVIYNLPNIAEDVMIGTDYTPIPAVLIPANAGEALKNLFATNEMARARIRLRSVERVFSVTRSLLCEHVGVRVQIEHPIRGDLRITLRSPQGTHSVLQHVNMDTNSGPADWTFWSTHHFLESSYGDWTVAITDERLSRIGTVRSVSLLIHGTEITDTDHDGLDDAWELAHFRSLAFGPQDDPDGDGFSNAREQVMGTDPLAWDVPLKVDMSPWQLWGNQRLRLSWPAATQYAYKITGGTNVEALSVITNIPGRFPETEWFTTAKEAPQHFFEPRVRTAP